MRKLLVIACAGLVACVCLAQPKTYIYRCSMGTNTSANFTHGGDQAPKLYVDNVYVTCNDGISTSTVGVKFSPKDPISLDVVIATNAVAGKKKFIPRVDGSDNTGTALTSDPPWRYLIDNEQILVSVSGSPTGKIWTVTLKGED